MSNAQIITLKKQIESGKMETDAAYILKFIIQEGKNGANLSQMEDTFTMKTATIVARLSGLEDLGLIYKQGEIEENGSTYSIYFYEPDEFIQANNRELVRVNKFKKVVVNLQKRFPEYMNEGIVRELDNAVNNALNAQQTLF